MTRILLALALAAWAGSAGAAPPEVGSEDWQISHPHSDWIVKQHDRRGYWCCDLGDFAIVRIKIEDGHYVIQAIHPDAARGIPASWLVVPDEKIVDTRKGGGNPMGVPAAWFLHEAIQCFLPPDMQ